MSFRLIARMDIKGANLIKGVHLEGLRVIGNPYEFALDYYKQGVDEIIYMDVVASLYGRNNLTEILEHTAQDVFVPITAGGGVRSTADVKKLLRSGADKVAINTAATHNPNLISELAEKFGSQCIVASIEAIKQPDGTWLAFTDNGREKTQRDVVSWAAELETLGAGEILLTSVDKEGTSEGFDYELVQAVSDVVNIPVIASGGFGQPGDVKTVEQAGADAAAFADFLHYKKGDIAQIRQHALQSGINVREST